MKNVVLTAEEVKDGQVVYAMLFVGMMSRTKLYLRTNMAGYDGKKYTVIPRLMVDDDKSIVCSDSMDSYVKKVIRFADIDMVYGFGYDKLEDEIEKEVDESFENAMD